MVFVVNCLDPELSAYLSELLGGLPPASANGPPVEYDVDAEADHLGPPVEALIANINLDAIEAADGNLLFHAGAVADPAGGVAVICGPSGSGKSTLTARLVESGLAYLTDETTCIDPTTMSVTPFRKPLSLKAGSRPLFAQLRSRFDATPGWFLDDDAWLAPYTALGGSQLPTVPLVTNVLVFPEYAAGQPLRVERLSEGEAAFTLGGNSSRLRAVRGGPLPALARLVAQAPGFRIRYDDVDAAADQVRELLAA